MSDPSFITDEFGSLDDMEELDGVESANQRNFMLIMGGLGGLMIVAVIIILVVFSGRSEEKSDIERTNEVVMLTNAAVETIVAETATSQVLDITKQAVAQAESAAQQAASATADALAGTAAADATSEAQPTPTNTSTPTPVIADTPTPTPEGEVNGEVNGEGNGEGTPGETDAVAQVNGTSTASSLPTRTNTPLPARPGASSVPDTGFGLSAVLLAATLVVVVFVVRRLRMAT
jgi:hypothetical protein